MTKEILLFSHDPGGANTIIPLINPLIEKGYNVRLFGKGVALNKYNGANLPGLHIMEFVNNIEIRDIENFLKKENPDFIITGTSANDFTERYIWKSAESLGLPCFAIFDQWINYGIRFSEYTPSEIGEYNRKKEHPYLPGKILLMDKYAEEEAKRDGLDPSRLLVTGQPYFEYLLKKSKAISHDKIKNIRENLGIGESDFLITYASEPVIKDYNSLDYWGYTEKSILANIVKAIKRFPCESIKKIKLLIKLHPREDIDNYYDILSGNSGISVMINKDFDSHDLIMASDMICGMSSVFLIEAVILNKPVISILIGLKRENPFVLDRRGLVKSILDENTLLNELNLVIEKSKKFNYNFEIIEDSINNIIFEMEKYLWES